MIWCWHPAEERQGTHLPLDREFKGGTGSFSRVHTGYIMLNKWLWQVDHNQTVRAAILWEVRTTSLYKNSILPNMSVRSLRTLQVQVDSCCPLPPPQTPKCHSPCSLPMPHISVSGTPDCHPSTVPEIISPVSRQLIYNWIPSCPLISYISSKCIHVSPVPLLPPNLDYRASCPSGLQIE